MCFLVFLVVFSLLSVIDANNSVFGQRCGTKVCQYYEYCSKFHNQCENCSLVCDTNSHNFDQELCMKECQDYVNDLRYVKSSHYAADTKILQNQQMIMMIIMILILILFIFVHGTHLIRFLRRRDLLRLKNFTKKTIKVPIELIHENPHTNSPKMQDKTNRINGTTYSVSGVGVGSVQTVSTPLSKRYPAEDSTLDYSYDNGGLAINLEKK